jgi:hypothetical protein
MRELTNIRGKVAVLKVMSRFSFMGEKISAKTVLLFFSCEIGDRVDR